MNYFYSKPYLTSDYNSAHDLMKGNRNTYKVDKNGEFALERIQTVRSILDW